MFVIELGHEGVNHCQNFPRGFVGSPSRASREGRGGTTSSGSNLLSHFRPGMGSAHCIGFMFVEVKRLAMFT